MVSLLKNTCFMIFFLKSGRERMGVAALVDNPLFGGNRMRHRSSKCNLSLFINVDAQ